MNTSIANFADVIAMNANADYSIEFRNLIIEAEEKATDEEKTTFSAWYAEQNFHDLNGIESSTVPSDHFEFAGGSWEPYMGK